MLGEAEDDNDIVDEDILISKSPI